jgi:hypothetical protein
MMSPWLPRADSIIKDVGKALDEGLNPNIQWAQADIKGQRSTGGCVINTFSEEFSWANYNTPLPLSLKKQEFDTAAILLKNGALIDLRNALERSPLHEAIVNADSEAVQFLIDNGADLNAATKDRSFEDANTHRSSIAGILPLHEAIRTWNLRLVMLLIEGGVDLTQTSPGGWTFLDLALLVGNESIAEFLYRYGAQISDEAPLGEKIVPGSLRQMAPVLLADTDVFPSSTCRTMYLHIISCPEFLSSFKKYSTSSAPNCTVIFDTLFSLLSRLAEKTQSAERCRNTQMLAMRWASEINIARKSGFIQPSSD